MSPGPDSAVNPAAGPSSGFRPEELPPVAPPSAGFIVQLFLIPALIVMAVVGVWVLFGKLADSDSNWQQLTSELGSSNEHRRWRAALGLAQLLQSEQNPAEGQIRLSQNPEVVGALTGLFKSALATTTPTAEDVTHLEFLGRVMAALDDDESTLPLLAQAMAFRNEVDPQQLVRKSALMSVAVIAGRKVDGPLPDDSPAPRPTGSGPVITDSAVLDQLRQAAQEPEPVIRHLAGWTYGSVGGEEAMSQLRAMLMDGDRYARANAAIGLARNGSADGADVLATLIATAMDPFDPKSVEQRNPEEQRRAAENFPGEQSTIVRNCLRAVESIWPQLDSARKSSLLTGIEKIAADFRGADVRLQASKTLRSLK